MRFVNGEGLNDDELIEAELGDDGNPNDCLFSTFWKNQFPIPQYIKLIQDEERKKCIFYIMQYCYKYGKTPDKECKYIIIFFVICISPVPDTTKFFVCHK